MTHASSFALAVPPALHYFTGKVRLIQFLHGELGRACRASTVTALTTSRAGGVGVVGDAMVVYGTTMRLSLTKDTYQRAGLQGQASLMSRGKYNVTLDLAQLGDGSATRRGAALARVTRSFETVFVDPCEWHVSFASPPTPALLAELACEPRRMLVQHMDEEARLVPDWDLVRRAPIRAGGAEDDGDFAYEVAVERQESVLTDIALLSVAQTVPASVDPYVTTYTCTSPNTKQSITTRTITGFISSHLVSAILDQVHPARDEWVTIQIRGFEHTPVAWIGSEHGCTIGGGENCITVLVTGQETSPGRNLVMWEIMGARDSYG